MPVCVCVCFIYSNGLVQRAIVIVVDVILCLAWVGLNSEHGGQTGTGEGSRRATRFIGHKANLMFVKRIPLEPIADNSIRQRSATVYD